MFKIVLGDHAFQCAESEDLLAAGRKQGVHIPIGCRSGGCGMCKIQILEGQYERGLSSREVLPDEEREKHYALGCRTYPRSDLRIKAVEA